MGQEIISFEFRISLMCCFSWRFRLRCKRNMKKPVVVVIVLLGLNIIVFCYSIITNIDAIQDYIGYPTANKTFNADNHIKHTREFAKLVYRHRKIKSSSQYILNTSTTSQTYLTSPATETEEMLYTKKHSSWRLTSEFSMQDKYSKGVMAFRTMLKYEDYLSMKQLLKVFVSTVDSKNLTYFMYGGTLLGSYRHFGMIPWDDDVDLIMNVKDKPNLVVALSKLHPNYTLDQSTNFRWKFYAKDSTYIKGVSWRYPFLDICFYEQDGGFIKDIDPGYQKRYTFPLDTVFPLIKRPYWGMLLNAPFHTFKFIIRTYSISLCQSMVYTHRFEIRLRRKPSTVPCSKLKDKFPFVQRKRTRGGVNETLQAGGKVVAWWFNKYERVVI